MNILIKKKPNELIIPETVNFTELVRNSNTTLSLSQEYQSNMIKILNEEFSEQQQQWYIANLYMYMNYHPTNDYPINLENVFKMIGFANKGNAMKTIKSNFTKDEDYKIMLFHTEKRKNEGGFNKEDVMLNIDTFKSLCMLAKTDKGKKIRRYYVKLENIHNKIIKEEIEQHNLLLQEKDQEIKKIQDERVVDKKLEKHKILLNMLKDKNCIYLIELSENLVKIGSSCEINKRRDRIQAVYGGEGVFLDVFECNEFRNVERNILNDKVIKENKFKSKLDTGHTSNEVVILSNTFTYNQLLEIVEKHIHTYNFLTPSQILEKQKLDIIESLINKGEKLSDIINVFSTPLTITQNIPNVIQIQEKEKDIITLKPNYGRHIQKIDPNNLTRIVQLYKNMETLMENKKYDTFSETGIRDSIKNNTIYKKYRWMFVDNDKNPMIVHNIQPTIISKKGGCSVILELNRDKSTITKHFNSINVATQELRMSAHSVKKMIETANLYNNHYYIYLNNCAHELLETYDTKVFKYVPKCAIKIKCIHPETKQEQFFPSLQHAREFCKVHHKTVHKAINEKKLLNGFYWEFV
jgi:phage anti-repressor protein